MVKSSFRMSFMVLLVFFALLALYSCTKPCYMPAKHLDESPTGPTSPGNSAKYAPTPDNRDKVIQQQAELLELYEARIRELETKLNQNGVGK